MHILSGVCPNKLMFDLERGGGGGGGGGGKLMPVGSTSMKKYKMSNKNGQNASTISVTKKGHCACSHHGLINIPTGYLVL
jgi:hypothetical protein